MGVLGSVVLTWVAGGPAVECLIAYIRTYGVGLGVVAVWGFSADTAFLAGIYRVGVTPPGKNCNARCRLVAPRLKKATVAPRATT